MPKVLCSSFPSLKITCITNTFIPPILKNGQSQPHLRIKFRSSPPLCTRKRKKKWYCSYNKEAFGYLASIQQKTSRSICDFEEATKLKMLVALGAIEQINGDVKKAPWIERHNNLNGLITKKIKINNDTPDQTQRKLNSWIFLRRQIWT